MIKNPNILVAALMLVLASCNQKASLCNKVKSGIFVEYSPVDKIAIKIVRTDSLQTETNLSTGDINISRIQWITPCSFYLIKVAKNDGDSIGELDLFFQKNPIKVDIIEVKKEFYIYYCRIDSIGKSLTLVDTVFFSK